MLSALVELGQRVSDGADKWVPDEYAMKRVKWVCSLDSSTGQAGVVETKDDRGRGLERAIPVLKRSGTKVKPQLLADRADFVFGGDLAAPGAVQPAEFRALVGACARETGSADVAVVAEFLAQPPAGFTLPEELSPRDIVTFVVDGRFVVEATGVAEFWRRVAPRLRAKRLPELNRDALEALLALDEPGRLGQCLVCGARTEIARTHPVPLRFPRSVSDQEVAVVSANKGAFYSYGLEQSYVGPTCLPCARAYGRGLNYLVNEPATHLVLSRTLFVFWTREDSAFDLATFMQQPDPAEVRALLESIGRGRRATVRDETALYALALSASGGRAVVRDWIDTTVGRVEQYVARWFTLQRIADPRDGDPGATRPLGLFQLAASTVRAGAAADLPVTTPRALFRAALSGTPIPFEVAFQAVRRCRAEQGVTRPRAALIKLVLLSQEPELPREDYMVALEAEHASPAYHCGRLLAVIEAVQRAALPGVNATIVDRYYGAASSTPAVVFGALLRGAQPHLARLERDRPGAYVNLQRRLEDVMSRIGDWPTTLVLRDQALFSLGYYHQRAHDRAEAISRRAARAGGANANDDAAKE